MTALKIDSELCKSLDISSNREWLETDGLGGYSCGTICGANTRRYHGLLVSAVHPPVERFVMFSRLEETVLFAGAAYRLSTNFFEGAVDPTGFNYIRSFSRDLFPVWEFELPGVLIKKTIGMLHGESSVVILYEVLQADAPFTMQLQPFVAARDYHTLSRRNDDFNENAAFTGNTLTIRPYEGLPQIKIHVPTGSFTSRPDWYYNYAHIVELTRGYDSREDLFTPGVFVVSLRKGSSLAVVASTEIGPFKEGKRALAKEAERREKLLSALPVRDPVTEPLALAADQFLVRRGKDGVTVIAGYPWFTDWGRDTMISLPGLTLATGRESDGKKILETFLAAVNDGMIPNLFPDKNREPLYNTVDATLWLFIALYRYWKRTNDTKFIEKTAIPKLLDILSRHTAGTRYGIREDTDGLLRAGDPTVQLTWMDAKIGDWVVTPRTGKPVEVQALWYNAHLVTAELLEAAGMHSVAQPLRSKAEIIKSAFSAAFWNPQLGYYYDCIDGDRRDSSLRPNQILALSLPFPLADDTQGSQVLEKITNRLYTPSGLRTLSPDDPAYNARYKGGHAERDAAYHQGTVWAWLLGPYISALVRFGGRTGEIAAKKVIDGVLPHLLDGCVGSISEIFDAELPHTPRGAFAQAWSVGEILRAYVEEIKRR